MKQPITFDDATLNHFATAEWSKALHYLSKSYGLSPDDCKDVFQESFLTLYDNVSSGKLSNLTSSLSTYFMGICRNKALELLRAKARMPATDDMATLSLTDDAFRADKAEALIALDDTGFEREKQRLVCGLVRNLPSPCNELLWGYYRDELSLKALALLLGYSEGSIKVIKHRCTEKFKTRYQELVKKLF